MILKSYMIRMREPDIICICLKTKKQTTFWAIKHSLTRRKEGREGREGGREGQGKKERKHILSGWKGFVIYSKIKAQEIRLTDSTKLLCDYCKLNGALYNVFILIMDNIMPTFSPSSSLNYLVFISALRMLVLSPMYFSNISNPISCRKLWHSYNYLTTLIFSSSCCKHVLITTCDKL